MTHKNHKYDDETWTETHKDTRVLHSVGKFAQLVADTIKKLQNFLPTDKKNISTCRQSGIYASAEKDHVTKKYDNNLNKAFPADGDCVDPPVGNGM